MGRWAEAATLPVQEAEHSNKEEISTNEKESTEKTWPTPTESASTRTPKPKKTVSEKELETTRNTPSPAQKANEQVKEITVTMEADETNDSSELTSQDLEMPLELVRIVQPSFGAHRPDEKEGEQPKVDQADCGNDGGDIMKMETEENVKGGVKRGSTSRESTKQKKKPVKTNEGQGSEKQCSARK